MCNPIEIKQNECEKYINDGNQDENMTKYRRYGRWWYTTKKEALKAKRSDETIYYDDGAKAYYIRKTKKSFWGF